MAKVVDNILELIGDTPIVRLNKMASENSASLYAKLESFNPQGSVKDRTCLSMIMEGEKNGDIRPGDTIVEPTSGNTGIGLAYISAIKGYKLVLTMPDTMSIERRKILNAFGAQIILTDGPKGMKGAIDEADRIADENNWYQLQQFSNPANPKIHRETTAKEILDQIPDLDALVAGIGTGGTITGIGEVLREKIKKKINIIGVEPENSAFLTTGKSGLHKIQGIGAGFSPDILNRAIYDEIVTVSSENAFTMVRQLATEEGILAGISSGAACWAAVQVGRNMGKGKKIVVIFPDHGERYLSTSLFEQVE